MKLKVKQNNQERKQASIMLRDNWLAFKNRFDNWMKSVEISLLNIRRWHGR